MESFIFTKMDHIEFLSSLASQLGCSSESASRLTQSLIQSMTNELEKGAVLTFSDFGVLEVVKEDEHLDYSPVTNEPILIPPKLTPRFSPDEKLNETLHLESYE